MAKLTRRKDKNGLVLEKGEGQRKDGRYYYEWSDELGKRHFVYATTLAELRNKEKTVVFDVLTGISQDGANLTLNEAIEYWIKEMCIRDRIRRPHHCPVFQSLKRDIYVWLHRKIQFDKVKAILA